MLYPSERQINGTPREEDKDIQMETVLQRLQFGLTQLLDMLPVSPNPPKHLKFLVSALKNS
jgi:hypothetical protein